MKRFKLRIPVPAGKLETVIDDPEADRRGLLLVAHPHPLHGGSLDNKVVTTLARAANEAGWVSVRPNFRGVGMSDGEFDAGVGETDDLLAVARFVEASYPGLPWALAGVAEATRLAPKPRASAISAPARIFFMNCPPGRGPKPPWLLPLKVRV